jgi:orotidine-5'-phosphate decarboxylase
MVESFAARFAAVREQRGPLVWGLDPSAELLEGWGLGDNPDGLDRFVDLVLPVAAATVGVVKPQSAFYERHGWRGIRTLARLVREARASGLLVVLDAKRGDIGSTNAAYGDAYLGPQAPLAADALTVSAYLGFEAMRPLVERAWATGTCLFVVVRSSNPEGRALQTAVQATGQSVEAALLAEVARANAALAGGSTVGPVGAVVAPAPDRPPLALADAGALFLAPGIGAQGATLDDVAATFASCADRVLPSASRALLQGGPDPGRLADTVASWATEARQRLHPPLEVAD